MADDDNEAGTNNQQQKQPRTAAQIVAQAKGSIKQAKAKALEGIAKGIVEKIEVHKKAIRQLETDMNDAIAAYEED